MLDAARTVRSISAARQGGRARVAVKKIAKSRTLYAGIDPIASLDSTAKVALLEKVEQLARAKDPRVAQVMAGLASEYDVVLVARADGTLAADVRPLVRLSVTVIAEQNGRREVGSAGGGGRFGLAYFDDAADRPVCGRGRARGAHQPGIAPRTRWRDDRGAGPRLARHLAARSHRPWAGGRFQPQGLERLQRAHRPARGGQGRDGARRRHADRPPRLAQCGRRRQHQPAQRADRGRHSQGLHPGFASTPA